MFALVKKVLGGSGSSCGISSPVAGVVGGWYGLNSLHLLGAAGMSRPRCS